MWEDLKLNNLELKIINTTFEHAAVLQEKNPRFSYSVHVSRIVGSPTTVVAIKTEPHDQDAAPTPVYMFHNSRTYHINDIEDPQEKAYADFLKSSIPELVFGLRE